MDEITKELLKALKMATLQNQLDMLMTGEELRKCESAIAKAEADLSAPQSDDGWIPWKGGVCPVQDGTKVDIRYRNGDDNGNESYCWCAEDHDWQHDGSAYDIVAYRVVKP